jgi:hypothetical protein
LTRFAPVATIDLKIKISHAVKEMDAGAAILQSEPGRVQARQTTGAGDPEQMTI